MSEEKTQKPEDWMKSVRNKVVSTTGVQVTDEVISIIAAEIGKVSHPSKGEVRESYDSPSPDTEAAKPRAYYLWDKKMQEPLIGSYPMFERGLYDKAVKYTDRIEVRELYDDPLSPDDEARRLRTPEEAARAYTEATGFSNCLGSVEKFLKEVWPYITGENHER